MEEEKGKTRKRWEKKEKDEEEEQQRWRSRRGGRGSRSAFPLPLYSANVLSNWVSGIFAHEVREQNCQGPKSIEDLDLGKCRDSCGQFSWTFFNVQPKNQPMAK